MMKMKSLLLAALFGAWVTSVSAQGVGQLGAGQVWGNMTANQRLGQPSTVTGILDRALGTTRGAILERGAFGWAIVGPGSTAGLPWVSNGAGADPAYQLLTAVGGGTGNAFFSVAGPATSIKTYTFPNVNATMAALAVVQTWTGAQSYTDGTLVLLGATSGSTTLKAAATGGGTVTLPTGNQTLAALGLSQIWTGLQQFTFGNVRLLNTAQTGSMSLNAASAASANTITFPNGTTDSRPRAVRLRL